jgi:hypothetical protein
MLPFQFQRTPSTNGFPDRTETCLFYLVRVSGNPDRGHWQHVLRFCHVPAQSPAVEWQTALQRVLWCSVHLPIDHHAPDAQGIVGPGRGN